MIIADPPIREIQILDHTGHTRHIWNPDNALIFHVDDLRPVHRQEREHDFFFPAVLKSITRSLSSARSMIPKRS